MAKKRRKPRPRRPPAPPSESAGPEPEAATRSVAKPAPPVTRKPIDDQRPPAPWGSFPLVELVVAVALVMLVAALVVDGARSTALLATGLALGSLAGLELSIREHFGGYRSHTALLAGAAAVATLAFLFYVVPDLLPPAARLAVAAVIGAGAAYALARSFRARSGRLVKLR